MVAAAGAAARACASAVRNVEDATCAPTKDAYGKLPGEAEDELQGESPTSSYRGPDDASPGAACPSALNGPDDDGRPDADLSAADSSLGWATCTGEPLLVSDVSLRCGPPMDLGLSRPLSIPSALNLHAQLTSVHKDQPLPSLSSAIGVTTDCSGLALLANHLAAELEPELVALEPVCFTPPMVRPTHPRVLA